MATVVLTGAFLLGILTLGFGAYLAWPPAGFLVVGLALVVVPVLYARGGLRETSGSRISE